MSPAGKARDHAAENANRSRLRLELRPTDEEREAIENLRAQLGGVTVTGTLLGSAEAVRVLLAGGSKAAALAAARERAALPPPPPGPRPRDGSRG